MRAAMVARWTAGLALAAWTMPAAAQNNSPAPEGLDLAASTRLRYEAIANPPRAGLDTDESLVNLRTILHGSYRRGAVSVVAELWDSRVYGDGADTPVTTGEVNAAELVQAYIGVEHRFGVARVAARIGRMMLNIASRRLIAADEYRNTTNGYTGVAVDLAPRRGMTGTLIYVLPQQRRPDDRAALRRNAVAVDRESFDVVLWGGTMTQTDAVGPLAVEGSFYHLGERDTPGRPTRDRRLDTYGGRVFRDADTRKPDIEVEGFYQSGSISTAATAGAPRMPVSAWFVHGDAGYTFAGAWKPRVAIEYDYASGDRAGGSYGRFDTLFGMRRADLAPSGLYNAIARTNISTPGVRVEVLPSKRVDAFVSYRAMWLAARTDAFSTTNVRDPRGNAGSFAGHQIDSRLRWWIKPAVLRFEADAIVLAKGRFLNDAPNAPPRGTTAYGSLNLTATF
jgi:hypothetical protein